MGRPDDDLVIESDVADGEVVDPDVVDAEVVDDGGSRPRPVEDDDLFGVEPTAQAVDEAEALTEGDLRNLVDMLKSERDDFLDTAKRVQADFENYKRRVEAQRVEHAARAAEHLVIEMLPVLDACEAAIAHGASDVEPIHAALFGTLAKQGLAVVADAGVPFDPNIHEAVLSESGDEDEPVVAEVMRTGFLWKGRVVRPAMVKVRG